MAEVNGMGRMAEEREKEGKVGWGTRMVSGRG